MFDSRFHLSHWFAKRQRALPYNSGCMFIATNTDAVTHLTDAQEWAGNGSMVGAIKGSTKREPTVVGKPAPFMLDYIANKFSIRKDQICMVGLRGGRVSRGVLGWIAKGVWRDKPIQCHAVR